MTIDAFRSSIANAHPPDGLNPLLLALWYDARNDWDQSHSIVQDIETKDAAWIHAYLHRKEGDNSNAAYWYHRAGKPVYRAALKDEWAELLNYFIDRK